ncbi:MAG: TraB/GumN family protein [Bacillaceae bacterium]|nr:TraB/GumN family protein [Bacillaceae bacterium]
MKLWMKFFMILVFAFSVTGIAGCSGSSGDGESKETQRQESLGVESDKQEADHQTGESDGTEKDTETTPNDAKSEGVKTGFFWRVDHAGNTVYLLGSIHVGTDDFYPMDDQIEGAFEESSYLAVEADIVNVNPLEVQSLIQERGMYSDGSTIEDHLSPELFQKLEETLKEYGINVDMLQPFEPWYIVMLLESLQIMKQGYDEQLGVDYYFLSKADGKEIIELEGIEYQINMFDSFSEDVQTKLLELNLNYEGDLEKEMEGLMKVWKSGDEEKLVELTLDDGDGSEEYQIYMDALLDERNIGMVEKIEKFLKSKEQETYFVIVGAAHYVGEQGIIELLEEKGYEVKKQY